MAAIRPVEHVLQGERQAVSGLTGELPSICRAVMCIQVDRGRPARRAGWLPLVRAATLCGCPTSPRQGPAVACT